MDFSTYAANVLAASSAGLTFLAVDLVQVEGLALRYQWDEVNGKLVVDIPETETLTAELNVLYD